MANLMAEWLILAGAEIQTVQQLGQYFSFNSTYSITSFVVYPSFIKWRMIHFKSLPNYVFN